MEEEQKKQTNSKPMSDANEDHKELKQKIKRNPAPTAIFNQEMFGSIQRDNKELKNTEIFKILAEEWKNLEEKERSIYVLKSQKIAAENPIVTKQMKQKSASQDSNEQPRDIDDSYDELLEDLQNQLGQNNGLRETSKPLVPFMRFHIENFNIFKTLHPNSGAPEIGSFTREKWQNAPQSVKDQYISDFERENKQYQQIKELYYEITENKNQKPLTPYFRFFQETLQNYQRRFHDKSNTEITTIMSQDWQNLDSSKQRQYELAYVRDQSAYQKLKNAAVVDNKEKQDQLIEEYNTLLENYEKEKQESLQKLKSQNLFKKLDSNKVGAIGVKKPVVVAGTQNQPPLKSASNINKIQEENLKVSRNSSSGKPQKQLQQSDSVDIALVNQENAIKEQQLQQLSKNRDAAGKNVPVQQDITRSRSREEEKSSTLQKNLAKRSSPPQLDSKTAVLDKGKVIPQDYVVLSDRDTKKFMDKNKIVSVRGMKDDLKHGTIFFVMTDKGEENWIKQTFMLNYNYSLLVNSFEQTYFPKSQAESADQVNRSEKISIERSSSDDQIYDVQENFQRNLRRSSTRNNRSAVAALEFTTPNPKIKRNIQIENTREQRSASKIQLQQTPKPKISQKF